MVKTQAAQKNIILEERYDGAIISADHKRLRQILLNLLSNAIKFTPKDGNVKVRIERRNNDRVALIIEDSGVGIAAADMARIFIPFGRTEGSKFKGAGLGLPLSRELTRAMNGEFKMSSVPGEGTRVELVFGVVG
jgi:signal transduction histidine kinase